MINRKQKLNKILAISAAILLAVFSVFAVSAPQKYDSSAPISASAEEITETSEETPEEETIYPTDNLFDISKVVQSNNIKSDNRDITCSVYGGSIGVLKDLCPSLKFGDVVTLSLRVKSTICVPPTFVQIQGQILNFETGNVTFTVTEAGLNSNFYLYNTTFENMGVPTTSVYTDIMLNLGDVAYPYRPYNGTFYDKGYTAGESAGYTQGKEDGKEEGKEEGYTEGYNAASDDLNLGVLKGAELCANIEYANGETLWVSYETPTFTYNGIDLAPFRDKYYYYNNDTDNMIERAEIYIIFAVPFVYEQFPITFFGSSDSVVYGGHFKGTDGKQYACERDVTANYSPFKIDEGSYTSNLQVVELVVLFGRASDTLDGCFLCVSGQFRNGFAAGYNEGLVDGFDPGFDAGKRYGYNDGYAAGVADSNQSGFASLLFAVVDTPVKAFSSLLDFEILGVNLKNFVLSVLTLAFFISILRWILGKSS